jgi:hypothetical protein
LRPPAKGAQSAGFDQAFQGAAVHLAQVYPLAKVVNVDKGPSLLAGSQNGLHRSLADILDGSQPVTDSGLARIGIFLDCEIKATGIDVRRENLDAQPPRLGDEQAHFFGVAPLHGQEGGHILHRVMGLEEGRLAGDDGIVGRVGLTKAVAGEILKGIKDLVGHRFVQPAVLGGALDEGCRWRTNCSRIFLPTALRTRSASPGV